MAKQTRSKQRIGTQTQSVHPTEALHLFVVTQSTRFASLGTINLTGWPADFLYATQTVRPTGEFVSAAHMIKTHRSRFKASKDLGSQSKNRQSLRSLVKPSSECNELNLFVSLQLFLRLSVSLKCRFAFRLVVSLAHD